MKNELAELFRARAVLAEGELDKIRMFTNDKVAKEAADKALSQRNKLIQQYEQANPD